MGSWREVVSWGAGEGFIFHSGKDLLLGWRRRTLTRLDFLAATLLGLLGLFRSGEKVIELLESSKIG